MRAEQLIEYYPRLYHMAWAGSWKSIEQHGLLSTQELLKLYQRNTKKLIAEHRPHWVEIKREGLPHAVLRDQKPMSDAGVRAALGGRQEPSEWYSFINSMVFFWPTKARLETMMSADAYQGMQHDLIVVDTRRLVEGEFKAIRLSHMNSGATRPIAHRRDLGIFKTIDDFPFDNRKKLYGLRKALAEVCVMGGVKAIREYAIDVKTVSTGDLINIE